MGFDDLDKAMDEQNQNDEQDGGKDIEEVLDEADEDAADVVEELESEPSSSGSSATSPEALTEPAFEYEDVRQSPLYAREETWDEFEDAVDLDVVRALREAGVRGESKREIHDAALQVAAERPQEVAELVVDNRLDGN